MRKYKQVHQDVFNQHEAMERISAVVQDLAAKGHTRADMIGVFSECLYNVAQGFEMDGLEIHIFKTPEGVLGVKVTNSAVVDVGEPS